MGLSLRKSIKLLGRLGETTPPLGDKAKWAHQDFAGKMDDLEGLILDLKRNGRLGHNSDPGPYFDRAFDRFNVNPFPSCIGL